MYTFLSYEGFPFHEYFLIMLHLLWTYNVLIYDFIFSLFYCSRVGRAMTLTFVAFVLTFKFANLFFCFVQLIYIFIICFLLLSVSLLVSEPL